MDPKRFDRLTQALACRLGQGEGAERAIPAERAARAARPAAPTPALAGGTCPPGDRATSAPYGHHLAVSTAVCRWEDPPLPAGSTARPRDQTRRAARAGPARALSPREWEVAELIGQGLKNREIAALLVVSERTVHAHVRNLLDKLDVASRAQIAGWAAERAHTDE